MYLLWGLFGLLVGFLTYLVFLCRTIVSQVVTGYLPSVILILFLYTVPPTMMLFSAVEGSISRSGRKKSACCKILYFTIWNVFFVNVFSGSLISQWSVFSSVKDLPTELARAVPTQVILSPDILVCELNIYLGLCVLYQTFIFDMFYYIIFNKDGIKIMRHIFMHIPSHHCYCFFM